MQDSFIEDGRNRFLRISAETADRQSFEERMLINNRPEGLLSIRPGENESGTYYDYNVTGLSSLKDCEGEVLLGNYLRAILFRLEMLSGVLYEYMLEPSKIRLDEERIFLRKETGEVFFIYDPSKKESLQKSLERLMEYFLKRLNPSAEKEVLLLYGLYAKSREENAGLGTLADYWRENSGANGTINETSAPGFMEEEDLRIYEELGMDAPGERKKEEERPQKTGSGKLKGRLLETSGEADETVEEPLEIQAETDLSELYEKEERGGTVKEAGRFIKTYAFEIAVGIIVLGGTIAMLLR